jgi:hypothetical protein
MARDIHSSYQRQTPLITLLLHQSIISWASETSVSAWMRQLPSRAVDLHSVGFHAARLAAGWKIDTTLR